MTIITTRVDPIAHRRLHELADTVTTRNRLSEELAKWRDYGVLNPIAFACWLTVLPVERVTSYEAIPLAEAQVALERLTNCKRPLELVAQWMTPMPALSVEQQGMEYLS